MQWLKHVLKLQSVGFLTFKITEHPTVAFYTTAILLFLVRRE